MSERLAALRDRIRAKEDAVLGERLAKGEAARRDWEEGGSKERAQEREAAQKRDEDAAANKVLAAAGIARAPSEETAAKRSRSDLGPHPTPQNCGCGLALASRAVTKEGTNKGRCYVSCPRGKKEFGGCGFFAWLPQSGEVPSSETPEVNTLVAPLSAISQTIAKTEAEKCRCGLDAEVRTVTRECPHRGRRFVTCPRGGRQDGGCGLFDWVQLAPSTGGTSAAASFAPAPTVVAAPDLGVCRCGLPLESRVVAAPGANSGRAFLRCPKGKQEFGGCGFFQWSGPPAAAAPPASGDAEASASVCLCGSATVTKTVASSGANFGRAYVSCVKGKRNFGGCGFFAWVAAPAG